MGIPVSGVSELVLEVTDLHAAEAFYADVLGLPVVDRWPEREAIWVMAGAAYAHDPDGHVVELWTWDVAEHLRRDPPAASA